MSGWKEASNASMADMPRGSKRPLASEAPLDEDAALETAQELQARMKAEKARRMQHTTPETPHAIERCEQSSETCTLQ